MIRRVNSGNKLNAFCAAEPEAVLVFKAYPRPTSDDPINLIHVEMGRCFQESGTVARRKDEVWSGVFELV